ncbi:hypothetical protein C0J52_05437 [Blattella germanica]|nr:hypothetical protein C0J52_05437 [Blattella germanica]
MLLNNFYSFSDQEIEFALNYLKTDAFKRIYGVDKPQKSSFLVFMCRSGSKAKKAMLKFKDSGFENVSFYKGSCEDWQEKPSKMSFYLPRLFRSMAGAPPGLGPQCKDLCYDDIIHLTKKKEIILIDVREPSEIKETGQLPGSIHIPLGEIKQALEVTPPAEFKQKYGIAKPDMTANLVFSCRSGKRSRAAMEAAMSMGFLNSRHYDGGYLDWEKHHPKSVAK